MHMTLVMVPVKMILKLLLLPVVAVLTLVYWLAYALINVGAYVVGPILFLIMGIIIYTVFKHAWYHTGLLSLIEGGIVVCYFGAVWIMATIQDLRDVILGFVMA